jgi:thiol-disulfide isomerase/thioredoxin
MHDLSLLRRITLAAMTLALVPALAVAAEKKTNIGDPVANLVFKDIHYLPRSLADFPKAKAFVLVYTNTSCPVVQRYMPVVRAMEKDYRDKGVQFLAVNVGSDDSIVETAAQAVRYEMEFPFVKDFGAESAATLGVQRTAEVVVLDSKRVLRYRGRIDDQYRLGGTLPKPTHTELTDAINAVLAGKDVPVAETPVDGCPITRPEPVAYTGKVTFADHVAPILQKNCTECHHPGTTAPFSLITYDDAKAQAEGIVEAISDGRMPPWYASQQYGHFINKRSLTSEQKQIVTQWVRTGMVAGDVSKLPQAPPPPKAEDKWLIGKPDLKLTAPEHTIPATGLIPYKYIVLPAGFGGLPYIFGQDTWMQGIQILPDNPKVVHHCNMAYILTKDKKREAHFITGTVPGGSPMKLDSNVGFCIPKDAVLILQIHYVTTGKEEKCKISVGFKYAQEVIQKQLRHQLLVDHKFAIPPGAPAHPVGNAKELECDAEGIGLFVHMHLRGRDMTFKATKPGGTSETLLVVPNYSFDWQIPYVWQPGAVKFPKGTRIECLAHYDNSTFNPYNPDPKATVTDGDQTKDEMLNGFVFYTDANEHLNLHVDPKTGHAIGGDVGKKVRPSVNARDWEPEKPTAPPR